VSGESGTWTIVEAKARLSELIAKASSEGPQTITRRGRKVAVVVSTQDWDQTTKRKGNLAEFFAASPLRDVETAIERIQDGPREIDL
jgi:prevent-host-death family protein